MSLTSPSSITKILPLYIHKPENDWPWGYTVYILLTLVVLATSAIVSKRFLNVQMVATILAAAAGTAIAYSPYTSQIFPSTVDIDILMQLYYPIVILKFFYSIEVLMFLHALPHIVCIVAAKFILATMFAVALHYHITFYLESEGTLVVMLIIISIVITSNEVHDITIMTERMKYLETLLIGDGIIGSGIAISMVQAATCMVLDRSSLYQGAFVFARIVIVSIVFGLIIAVPASFPLRYFYNDSVNGITYMVCLSYGVFFLCQNWLYISGIFSCITLVIFFNLRRNKLSDDVDKRCQHMIDMFYYNITTIVYFNCTFILAANLFPFEFISISEALLTFVYITLIKVIVLFGFYPILSRSRYGFDVNVMVAFLLGGKWGPMQVYGILNLVVTNHLLQSVDGDGSKRRRLCQQIFILLFCFNCFQAISFDFVLKRLGFLDLSVTRKGNIKMCAVMLDKQRVQHLSVIKMDRAYNEANWHLIHKFTDMQELTEGQIEDNYNFNMLKRTMMCNKCTNTVSFEPDADQVNELLRETQIRMLKALRVSFMRQYEQGFIDNTELKMLRRKVDVALNSEKLSIKFDGLKLQKNIILPKSPPKSNILGLDVNQQNIPESPFRRRCYQLAINKNFERFYLVLNCFCVLAAFVMIFFDMLTVQEKIVAFILDTVFYGIFLYEIIVKVFSCSYRTVWLGFLTYLCIESNSISFGLNMISSVDFVMYALCIIPNIITIYTMGMYIRISRITRLLRIIILLLYFYPKLQFMAKRNVQDKHMHSIAVALGMVRGYQELLSSLPTLSDNLQLQQIVKHRIISDRLKILRDLGLSQVSCPLTFNQVKTKQSIMICLKSIASSIRDLKSSGLIDDYEYQKLVASMEERMERCVSLKVDSVVPKNILYEVPWIVQDEVLFNYLYANADTRIWKPGDVIVRVGDFIPGIFVIITGMFKISYTPSDKLKNVMHSDGLLPVRDYIENISFDEPEESYVTTGHSIGDICMLTKRPYNVKITAYAPSQAFVIPQELLMRAIKMNRDPIHGLQSRIWRYVLTNVVKTILKLNPIYQSISFDDMNNMLDRAFVPNLVCFKIFVINEYIQDVLLVEGIVTDYNTGDVYKAPCYIPRTTQKISLTEQCSGFQPILVVIPLPDVDEYEVMNYSEGQSELVSHHDSDCMLHVKHYRNEQYGRRLKLRVRMSVSPTSSLEMSIASKKQSLMKFDAASISAEGSRATLVSNRFSSYSLNQSSLVIK